MVKKFMQIESIFCDILAKELNLPSNNIWIASQNRLIPPTEGLFLCVQMISARTTGNTSFFDPATNSNIYQVNHSGLIQVSAFSRDNSALERNWEISAAFNSPYALEKMNNENVRIFHCPTSTNNISSVTGGSEFYQFVISFNATWQSSKSKQVEYYTKFTVSQGDENKIDRNKFEIGEENP